jgi:ribonuclease HI
VAQDNSGSVTLEILSKVEGGSGEVPIPELMMVAAWYIWWQRREFVKGETIHTPERTAICIRVLATNYVRAYRPKYKNRSGDFMWKKPSTGMIKINVDASVNLENGDGATGAIARDDRGAFIAAATWVLPAVVSVDSAEITAIKNGLYLAGQIGCNSLQIESDCSYAVDAINLDDGYQGPDVATIAECKDLIREFATIAECKDLIREFAKVHFTYCFREANAAADGLAKHCYSFRSPSFWDVYIPDLFLTFM